MLPGIGGAVAASGGKKTLSFRGSSIATGSSNLLSTIAITDQKAGDLLLLFASCSGSPTMTTPADWTLFASYASQSFTTYIFSKIATSDGETISTAWSASVSKTIYQLAWKDATGIDVVAPSFTTPEISTIVLPSITPTKKGELLAFNMIDGSSRAITAVPDGFIRVGLPPTNSPVAYVHRLIDNPPGATGTKTFVWNSTTDKAGILAQIY